MGEPLREEPPFKLREGAICCARPASVLVELLSGACVGLKLYGACAVSLNDFVNS